MGYRNSLRLALALLLAAGLAPSRVRAQGAPEDASAKMSADITDNKDGLADRLTEDLLKRLDRKYGDSQAEKERRDRDKSALNAEIRADSRYWSGFAVLAAKMDKGQLSPGEKGAMDALFTAINKDLGDAKTEANLKNLSTSKKGIDEVQKKLDANKDIAALGGLNAFYDGLRKSYPPVEAPGAVNAGDVNPKGPLVRDSEVIREIGYGDRYLNDDGTFKIADGLHLSYRSQPDDPDGHYVQLVDNAKRADVRASEPIALVPGSKTTVTVRGTTYIIAVESEDVADKRATGGTRPDLVVHVLSTTIGKEKGKEVVNPGPALDAQTITLGGADGLAARALRKAMEGHCTKYDGTGACMESERYVQYVGEGENRKKFYVSVQGGQRAGLAFYPADQAEAAWAKIQNGDTPENFGDLRSAFATDIWDYPDGQPRAAAKGGSTPIDFGGSSYQYQKTGHQWELKPISKSDMEDIRKGPGGGAPAGGKTPDDSTGKTPAGADGWPATIAGGKLRLIPDVSGQLKKAGKDYRLYQSGGIVVSLAKEGIPDSADMSDDDVQDNRLPTYFSKATKVAVVDGAIAIEQDTRVLLYNVDAPLLMKDAAKMTNPNGQTVADPDKIDAVIRTQKNHDLAMRLFSLQMLPAGLKYLGYGPQTVAKTMDDAKGFIANNGDAAVDTISANVNGKSYTVRMKLNGVEKPIILIGGEGADAAPPSAAKKPGKQQAAAPPQQQDPQPAGGDAGGNPYALAPTTLASVAAGPWPMEETLKTTISGKEVTLTKVGDNNMAHAALYSDGQKLNYARWRVFSAAGDTGQNTPPIPIAKGMNLGPLVVQDGKNLQSLIIEPDSLPAHQGKNGQVTALEATFMPHPRNKETKHEMFVGHVAFLGAAPPDASAHEPAFQRPPVATVDPRANASAATPK